MRAKYTKLYLPLGFMIATYVCATGIFGAMVSSYRPHANPPKALYMVFYGVMAAESIISITVSCFWRMLSFKKTHLMERMSLLTVIVIGEGAIGVTKTVGRIMGKEMDVEGCFTIMCIIVILVSQLPTRTHNDGANSISHRFSFGHYTLITSHMDTTEPSDSNFGLCSTSRSSWLLSVW